MVPSKCESGKFDARNTRVRTIRSSHYTTAQRCVIRKPRSWSEGFAITISCVSAGNPSYAHRPQSRQGTPPVNRRLEPSFQFHTPRARRSECVGFSEEIVSAAAPPYCLPIEYVSWISPILALEWTFL